MSNIKLGRLLELEQIIEDDMAAFLRSGNALLEIREKKLYGKGTWTEYLKRRWPQYHEVHCRRLMNAAHIVGYLENKPAGSFLPPSEGVARPLSKLGTYKQDEMGKAEPELWADAWMRACEIAQPDYPTEKHVKQAVNEFLKKDIAGDIPDADEWAGELKLNTIYHTDVTTQAFLDSLPEGAVDFINKDPPWAPDPATGKSYHLYEAVADIADKALKPGGICAVYLGKLDLPYLLGVMQHKLDYEWCFASYHPHGTWSFRLTQFKECWRPIGIFRKPGSKYQTVYYPDAMESTREKEYHEWQQGIEPVKLLMEKYTKPGQVILEPYLGGGTAIVAAESLPSGKRNWVAFDIDADAIKATKRRLKDVGILTEV